MNSPEGQLLPSSILHQLLMFKITAFFLFNNRECFDRKSDQRKAAKSVVPNVFLLSLSQIGQSLFKNHLPGLLHFSEEKTI